MASALIIVWRESVEAILVVAILYAWLRNDDARAGLRWLGYGIAGGLGVALLLALAMMALHGSLAAATLEWFQTAMLFLAAGLIVQMVAWMRSHGRALKGELESGARAAVASGRYASIATLAAIAVGREGAETVLFLYGLMLEQSGAGVAGGAALGVLAALATFWLVSRGARWLSWRTFFHVSEALLLVFAGALMVGGTDRLLDMGVLQAEAPRWDSAWLIDDGRGVGAVLRQFAGYRARPDTLELAAWLGYWLVVLAWFNRRRVLRHA